MSRSALRKSVGYLAALGGLVVLFTLFDFAIDLRPPAIHSSYRFEIGPLDEDEPRILRQDNLSILVIRRSPRTIERLQRATTGLQDPESRLSHQPGWATNSLRSRHPAYFVAYAMGTDLGCEIEILIDQLGERCGAARWDFADRALPGAGRFRNLGIPDYNFTGDFDTLTIKP